MRNMVKKCVAILIGLALTATGLWAAGADEAPAAAAAKEYVTDPTTGKVVVAPEYGGTFTWGDRHPVPHCDPYIHGSAPRVIVGVAEKLGISNWAADRNEISFSDSYVPLRFTTGALAERWEMVDPLTYVFHIREGVRWHDKAPMIGRELTAQDVVYNFHRYTGSGSGFTEASAVAAPLVAIPFESITATDDSTVVFKLTQPKVDSPVLILTNWYALILPPEVIEQHGDLTDCDNMVGTGPYMLTEWVEGSSITYSKNPDYWDFDEKYPENRLPYIDQINRLIMPEPATQLAALRSGRLDFVGQDWRRSVTSGPGRDPAAYQPRNRGISVGLSVGDLCCLQPARAVALSRHQGAQGDADGNRSRDHKQYLLWGVCRYDTPGDHRRRCEGILHPIRRVARRD